MEILQADISDEESLREMASSTKVVLSTAGPFIKIGTPIVKACVDCGTNYCDITGESPWIRQLIDQFHDTAVEKKIHIVPACGFDSIPFDIGSYMIAKLAEKNGGAKWIKGYAKVNGKPSGGTMHTMLNLMETIPTAQMQDPHIIDPEKVREKTEKYIFFVYSHYYQNLVQKRTYSSWCQRPNKS